MTAVNAASFIDISGDCYVASFTDTCNVASLSDNSGDCNCGMFH